jgi:hypothetical protein
LLDVTILAMLLQDPANGFWGGDWVGFHVAEVDEFNVVSGGIASKDLSRFRKDNAAAPVTTGPLCSRHFFA